MKNIIFIHLISLVFGIFISSCHSAEKQQSKEVVSDVVTEAPIPTQSGSILNKTTPKGSSYSVFVPSGYNGKDKLPVIIFLDPHGNGNYPLEKYKSIAEKFSVILVGSNDSKNGMGFEQAINIAGDLLNEAQTNLPGQKNNISLAGFSGGAKAAIVSANSVSGFSSLIYCGAALPPGSIELKIPSLAFAGTRDMNFTEVRNFNNSLDFFKPQHAYIEWNGKHEWPDSSNFLHSFYWIEFSLMKNSNVIKNDSLIFNYRKTMDENIAKELNILTKVQLLQEEIEMLKGIISVDNLKTKLMAAINSSEYKKADMTRKKIFTEEDLKKQELIEAFEGKDLVWWKKQTDKLSFEKQNESHQRLLGYISLASWSYSSKAVTANNFPFAQKTLTIYKLADPENSEQPFLKACLYAKNNMLDSSIIFLREAVKLGLNDRSKIENEGDLMPLHSRSDFREVVNLVVSD